MKDTAAPGQRSEDNMQTLLVCCAFSLRIPFKKKKTKTKTYSYTPAILILENWAEFHLAHSLGIMHVSLLIARVKALVREFCISH